MKKIALLSVLVIMALFSVSSCSPGVSPQDYDRVSSELNAVQSQLASLQGKLAEAELLRAQSEELNKQYQRELETIQAKYKELGSEYERLKNQFAELNKQYEAAKSELGTIRAKYGELSSKYEGLNNQFEELNRQYNILIEGTAEINGGEVEQAVFKLINQERKNKGLIELMWGENLYKWAQENNRNMAANRRIEYSDYSSWQNVFWAARYSTTGQIANAALIIWKNSLQYERNFLNSVAIYGAIAAYKSGDIFYITYIASPFR